jgi:ankyrin repeat protein
MDKKFHPAIVAIKAGDLEGLKALVSDDPTLATGRSSRSHPTLLQCLALEAIEVPNQVELAQVLVNAGAELNEPLVACGSCDNPDVAAFLLDRGAAIDGLGGWSPIEEALYWNSGKTLDLLLRRGASIANLRIAAGLGRTDVIENFFDQNGKLKPEAGKINWPWGDLGGIAASSCNSGVKTMLAEKVASWSNDPQSIVDNAFVYACMHGHIEAAKLLLQKGASLNAIPAGFDFSGSGLHYAALNGHRSMAEFLVERGADADLKDTKVGGTPAGWADYGGHQDLKTYLESLSLPQ